MLYSAEIIHDKDSLIRLFVTEFRIYEKKTMFFRLLLGGIIVILAILLNTSLPIKGIMIALGAWFISSTDFPARIRADDNIRKFQGNYPGFKYNFKNSYFTLKNNKSMNIEYSKIEHLVSDNKYIYIFMGRANAIVLNTQTLKDFNKNKEGDGVSDFKKFLEDKSGKKFESSKSLISLNLFDLLDIFKKSK